MAKLYAELTSDKGGRVASKGADSRMMLEVFQNNRKIGILKVYPIHGETNGHRVTWQGLNETNENIIQNTDDIVR